MQPFDPKIEKWRKWISRICEDVQSLVWSSDIYNDVVAIVTENPEINIDNRFYRWIARNYVHTALMNVRRQLDEHKDAVSLMKLLRELEADPEKADRTFHVSLYPADLKHIAHLTFDRLAGTDAKHIGEKDIRGHIEQLEEKRDWAKDFTNRRVAHLDKAKDVGRVGTFGELEKTTECLREITSMLFLLLHAKELQLRPEVQYDWKEIFRTTWIPEVREPEKKGI